MFVEGGMNEWIMKLYLVAVAIFLSDCKLEGSKYNKSWRKMPRQKVYSITSGKQLFAVKTSY